MQRGVLNSIGLEFERTIAARRAKYMDVFCNPGVHCNIEKPRIPLRYIQATSSA